MLCYICKQKEATVHLAQIAEGQMQKIDLCEDCAKEKGVQDVTSVSLASLLMGMAGAVEETKQEPQGAQCPVCGFTQADFKKTGRLGCSVCWETFDAALHPLLKAMHKGERHGGKIPSKAADAMALNQKVKELADELERAVRSEKYEDAAQIRDQIRELESKLKMARVP